jgi:hypothetical protein
VVQVPAEEGHLSFLDIVRTVSGAHREPSVRWIAWFFPVSKAARAWYWPLTSIQRRGLEWVEIRLCSPHMPSWRGQGQLYLFNLYTTPTTSLPLHLLGCFGEAAQPCVLQDLFPGPAGYSLLSAPAALISRKVRRNKCHEVERRGAEGYGRCFHLVPYLILSLNREMKFRNFTPLKHACKS